MDKEEVQVEAEMETGLCGLCLLILSVSGLGGNCFWMEAVEV